MMVWSNAGKLFSFCDQGEGLVRRRAARGMAPLFEQQFGGHATAVLYPSVFCQISTAIYRNCFFGSFSPDNNGLSAVLLVAALSLTNR
jgi:hypothetical protein